MMEHTFADLLSGGGGASLGAVAAGLRPVWSVEYDAAIADCYERNLGKHSIHAKVQDVDYARLERVWWLHMSPICTNASNAKTDGAESAEDIAIADACARAIRDVQPVNVSLENVYPYRHFESFRRICRALETCGYNFKYWHLNSADYGVPQTRKRLILLASRERRVTKPEPTHQDPAKMNGQGTLFGGARLPWIGWYEAIEDLIPTLPESRFAEWQLKRLDEGVLKGMAIEPNVFVGGANKSQSFLDFAIENRASIPGIRNGSQPMSTLPADVPTVQCGRAFIVSNAKTEWGDGLRDGAERFCAVTGESKGRVKAFIVDGQETVPTADGGSPTSIRTDDEPMLTIPSSIYKGVPRAYIIGGGNTNKDKVESKARAENQPAFTVASGDNVPATTRAWLSNGRVVAMTPRALARFQSIPDSYELPEKTSLACRIIGNAIPPLLMEALIKSLLR